MSLISRRRQKTTIIRDDSHRAYILPDIGSRNLATREEIYGTYLAANANAPLPRLTVPIVVSSPNGIPNGDAYHWPNVSRQDVPVWEPVSARRADRLFLS